MKWSESISGCLRFASPKLPTATLRTLSSSTFDRCGFTKCSKYFTSEKIRLLWWLLMQLSKPFSNWTLRSKVLQRPWAGKKLCIRTIFVQRSKSKLTLQNRHRSPSVTDFHGWGRSHHICLSAFPQPGCVWCHPHTKYTHRSGGRPRPPPASRSWKRRIKAADMQSNHTVNKTLSSNHSLNYRWRF